MNRLVEAFTTTKNGGDTKVKGKKTPSRVYKIGDREVVEEKPLSEGGFAYVSLMRDVNSSQTFAMKKMKCTDRTRYQMALHECKILESLSGQPNIVNCYGHITEPGEQPGSQEVSLLLEYCDGGHLLDLLDRHKGILPTATIVKVMKDLMSAVNILHTQSPPIQHRDLKVENVLYKTASDSYLLCDFGSATTREYPHPSALSKSQMATLDEDIQRYTTLMYRSPEMATRGGGRAPSSSYYHRSTSSGILFTLICYRHPFQDQSVLAISNAKYHIDAKASERHPRPLTDLCRWMLSRDPTRRPTAKQVLDVFTDWSRVAVEGIITVNGIGSKVANTSDCQQPLGTREGTKPSRHESSKRRPKSLEPPHIHPSPTSSSSDEGREIHSAPDWSTPSDIDDELPSWQAFRTEPSRPQAATDSSSGDDGWKSFTDPNPSQRRLPTPSVEDHSADDAVIPSMTAASPTTTTWTATFEVSSTTKTVLAPKVPLGHNDDSLPEWTAFGGSISSSPSPAEPSPPPPHVSAIPSRSDDTSQFTTGHDVWSSGVLPHDAARAGQWEAFSSGQALKGDDRSSMPSPVSSSIFTDSPFNNSPPQDDAVGVETITTNDLINLNDKPEGNA